MAKASLRLWALAVVLGTHASTVYAQADCGRREGPIPPCAGPPIANQVWEVGVEFGRFVLPSLPSQSRTRYMDHTLQIPDDLGYVNASDALLALGIGLDGVRVPAFGWGSRGSQVGIRGVPDRTTNEVFGRPLPLELWIAEWWWWCKRLDDEGMRLPDEPCDDSSTEDDIGHVRSTWWKSSFTVEVTGANLSMGSMSVSQDTLSPAQPFTLSGTLRSTGLDATDVMVRFLRSIDMVITQDDTEVGRASVASLLAGTTSTVAVELMAPEDPGMHYYGACADVVPGESESTDNCSSGVSVTVMEPFADWLVLLGLYNATGGSNWRHNENWLTAEPPGLWHGVDADENGRVTGLRLANNRLSGSIPDVIGDLTALTSLDLDGNGLRGEIPVGLGRLTNLESLSLGDNQLSARIPSALGSLTNLQHLELFRNNLDGNVPDSLGRLTKLRSLSLAFNHDLVGALPRSLLQTNPLHADMSATNVCIPRGDDFDRWVTGKSGLVCGDYEVAEIDLAVFYTPEAVAERGGEESIWELIDMRVAQANMAYRESGVHLRLRVVHKEGVAYVEKGLDNDLDALAVLPEIRARRDAKGADLVHILTSEERPEAGSIYCGIASGWGGITSPESNAFSITLVDRRCDLIFVHELGHSMGLLHDRYAERTHYSGTGWQSYSHGYVNQLAFGHDPQPGRNMGGVVFGGCWYTIMAYEFQCGAAGHRAEAIALFSNPRRIQDGDLLGIPDTVSRNLPGWMGPADAARSLNEVRFYVANFRPTVVNRSPVARGRIAAQALLLTGGAVAVDAAGAFVDPEGDPLTYEALSAAPSVVTVAVSGSMVTVTPRSVGSATITVKATDVAGSNMAATQQFVVAVHTGSGFSDPELQPGMTSLNASHIGELRSRITALRSTASLSRASWRDRAVTPGVTPVRAAHLTELRDAIDEVYAATGRQPPQYTDPTVIAGVTPIKAAHITELRVAVLALEIAGGQRRAGGLHGEASDARTAGRTSEEQGSELFAAAAADIVGSTTFDTPVLRRRPVTVDVNTLTRAQALVRPDGPAAPIVLNLFDDAVFTGRADWRELTSSGGYVLSGGIDGEPLGSMTLVVNGMVVTGTIRTSAGTYWIDHAGGGRHVVSQRDPSVTVTSEPPMHRGRRF